VSDSESDKTAPEREVDVRSEGRKVAWNDKDLTTSYANVCNVSSTPEEVTLLFGTNESGLNGGDVTVRLTERIILSPYAAKRLAMVITNVMKEYEKRFGPLDIGRKAE
jgi:hypothetical protein